MHLASPLQTLSHARPLHMTSEHAENKLQLSGNCNLLSMCSCTFSSVLLLTSFSNLRNNNKHPK